MTSSTSSGSEEEEKNSSSSSSSLFFISVTDEIPSTSMRSMTAAASSAAAITSSFMSWNRSHDATDTAINAAVIKDAAFIILFLIYYPFSKLSEIFQNYVFSVYSLKFHLGTLLHGDTAGEFILALHYQHYLRPAGYGEGRSS